MYAEQNRAVQEVFRGRQKPSAADLLLLRRALRDFEKLTGLATLLLPNPAPNRPVSFGRQETELCRQVWASCDGGCSQCHGVQGRIFEKLGRKFKPHVVRCAGGIIQLGVPVVVQGRHIATILSGKVRIDAPREEEFASFRNHVPSGCHAPENLERLREAYFETPVLAEGELDKASRLLDSLGQLFASIVARQPEAAKELDTPQVAQAKAFAQAHLSERVTTAQAARALNLSEAYFCRMFRKATGMTFRAYVAKHRVEAVKSKLLNTSAPITEICYVSGFQSVSDFNRVFKAVVGSSPSSFRNREGHKSS